MKALSDLDFMPFGEYRGTILLKVPAKHLLDIYSDGDLMKTHPRLAEYIRIAKHALEKELHDLKQTD